MTITWNLETKSVKELHVYKKNPRTLSKDKQKQLEESIDKFGVCQPVVINSDGTVIGGHQRLNAVKKNKTKEIQVYVPNRKLDDKEVEELNIRLNNSYGDWDYDLLANEWDLVDLVNWGFNPDDLIESPEIPPEENGSKKLKLSITFSIEDDLKDAKSKIQEIVSQYHGAKIK